MIDMHVSLPDLKYRSPPLWWFIVLGCLCLHSKAFFILSMYWLLRVLAFHSNVNAVPILGCPRQLLLSLFIKLDSAPQVWCCLIHHEEFSLLDSSESYPLIGCVHHANTHQGGQPVMNLPPVETYPSSMLSSAFMGLPSHPDMPLITCCKRLFVAFPMLFSMNSSWLVKSAYKNKWFGIINDVHHPYSCSEVCIWASKQMVPQSVLVGASF